MKQRRWKKKKKKRVGWHNVDIMIPGFSFYPFITKFESSNVAKLINKILNEEVTPTIPPCYYGKTTFFVSARFSLLDTCVKSLRTRPDKQLSDSKFI